MCSSAPGCPMDPAKMGTLPSSLCFHQHCQLFTASLFFALCSVSCNTEVVQGVTKVLTSVLRLASSGVRRMPVELFLFTIPGGGGLFWPPAFGTHAVG